MGQSTYSGPIRSLGGFYSQGPNTNISITAAAVTLDIPTYAGKIIRVNNPLAVITLPLINVDPDPPHTGPGADPNTQNNQGVMFSFIFETAATGAIIQAQGLDKIVGSLLIQGATVAGFAPAAANSKINLNGGTTGGAVGSMLSLQALVAHKWLLRDANLVGVGAPATPFS
jgi:hypothetical protein